LGIILIIASIVRTSAIAGTARDTEGDTTVVVVFHRGSPLGHGVVETVLSHAVALICEVMRLFCSHLSGVVSIDPIQSFGLDKLVYFGRRYCSEDLLKQRGVRYCDCLRLNVKNKITFITGCETSWPVART
jgi:hypothetical protein